MSAPVGDLWFQSREFAVVQDGEVLTIRRRPSVLFVLAGLGLLMGLGMRLLGARLLHGGLGALLLGFGTLIAVASAIGGLLGILQLLSPGMAIVYRLDRAKQLLTTQRERFPLAEVTGWEISTMLGGYPAIRFRAAGRSQFLLSVEPAKTRELDALLTRLQGFIGAARAAPPGDVEATPSPHGPALPAHAPALVSPAPMTRLRAWVLLGMGLLWTSVGYVAFRGASITDARGTMSVPVWSLGLFFAVMGLFHLFRGR